MCRTVSALVAVVLLPIVAGVCNATAQQGRSYQDPSGRFALLIPAGWTASAANNGVVISHGTALAMVSPFSGARSAREVVQLLARQYSAQWKGLQPVSQGDFDLNGAPAAYGMYTGTSPRGTPSLLRLVGVMPESRAYAVIISVPKDEFNELASTLQSMEGSIEFGEDRGAIAPRERSDASVARNAQLSSRRAGGSGSRNFYRMRWVQIMDQYGFAQPTEVARLLIPVDWKLEGGVTWLQATGCSANGLRFQARAVSPDGTSALEFFSPYSWQWSDDPLTRQSASQSAQLQPALRPCAMSPPVGALDYLRQAIVQNYRRGARVIQGSPMPQVAQAQNSMLRGQLAQQFQAGLVSGTKVDAGRIVLSYDLNGKPVEESITGVINIVVRPSPSASAAMQGGMATVNSYTIAASQLIAMRAPAGDLERQSKLYATMIASIRPNMRWVAAVQQVQLNIGNAQLKGAIDRSNINTKSGDETNAIITSQYRAQQEVQDRLANQYSQSERGVEHFIDPTSNERVELSAGYAQAWSNGQGEYILSDDVNFDPSVTLHENWKQLDRTNR